MRPLNRDGFSLLELLVAFTLLAVVFGAIQQTVVLSQRATGAQVQRMNVQQSVRAVGFYLSHVLRELDATEGDITTAAEEEIQFRGMRWAGILCTTPAAAGANVTFVIRTGLQYGLRSPDAALDSILLFRELDPAIRADDGWLVGELISSGAGICTDAAAGRRLVVEINAAFGGNPAALAGVTIGAPIRGFQMEELSLYEDAGGVYWLGQRTATRAGLWSTVRPIVGPLTDDGLSFAYFDDTGAAGAVPAEIQSVGLIVRGRSTERVRIGNRSPTYIRDSVATRITLRNNVRF